MSSRRWMPHSPLRPLVPLLLVLFLLAPAAVIAHNGEYRPPLPPPRIPDKAPTGVPTRPGEGAEPQGEVTPGPEGDTPSTPVPEAPIPEGPRVGMGRQDDRLTAEIWWELNRHRFLPRPDRPALGDELFGILLDAAAGGSDTVRERVVLALGRSGDPRAFKPLLAAATGDSPGVALSALLALGFSGESQAAPLLKEVVADGEATLDRRVFAVLALGLLGAPENAAFIREVLDEEWEPNVRTAAALAAGLIGDPQPVEALGRIMLGLHPLRSPETARLGDVRISLGLRCAAARALGAILTPRCYDYLVRALEGGHPQVQTAAAMVLAGAPGTAGLPALRRALEERGPLPLRQQALLGLAERGDTLAIEEAARILGTPAERDGLMGPFAALALGLTRDPARGEALLAVVADQTAGSETRAAAALALGLADCRDATAALEKVVGSTGNPRLMGWGIIADALLEGGLAKPLSCRILEQSDLPGPRRDAVMALRILAAPDTADLLVNELGDSYYVNREAALALAAADPERAARELSGKLRDPNVFAGRFAAHSIGVLLDPEPDGRLALLLLRMNLLCGAPVVKACLYVENEYLSRLVRNF